MSVCIISNVDDSHAIYVELALMRKGANVINWHWADFPSASRLTMHVMPTGKTVFALVQVPTRDLTLWIHRGFLPIAPGNLHPADVSFVKKESKEFLDGVLHELASEAFCVNPIDATRRYRSKMAQMVLAAKLHFQIPSSLWSNDPNAIRQFYDEHGGRIIAKHSTQSFWESADGQRIYIPYTSRVTEKDISNDAQLSACPSIFQREIPKAFELRVVFIGRNIFAFRIDSRDPENSVDWRQEHRSFPPCTVFDLPSVELTKIQAFVRASGLRYGSIDIVVDQRGQYFFLEVNETGQFLWIEERLPDVPLLDCFAEFLLSRNPEFLYQINGRAVRCRDFTADVLPAAIETRKLGHVNAEASFLVTRE